MARRDIEHSSWANEKLNHRYHSPPSITHTMVYTNVYIVESGMSATGMGQMESRDFDGCRRC